MAIEPIESLTKESIENKLKIVEMRTWLKDNIELNKGTWSSMLYVVVLDRFNKIFGSVG